LQLELNSLEHCNCLWFALKAFDKMFCDLNEKIFFLEKIDITNPALTGTVLVKVYLFLILSNRACLFITSVRPKQPIFEKL